MAEAELRKEFTELVTRVSPPNFADISFSFGHWGGFARITNIHGDHVDSITHQLDGIEGVGFAVTETGGGLAVEVFEEW